MTPSLTDEMGIIRLDAEYAVEVAITLLRELRVYS